MGEGGRDSPGRQAIRASREYSRGSRGASRSREATPGAGFGGMEIRIDSHVFDPDSHLLFWKPGTVPAVEPEGMALRLDKGTDLMLNTHLQPSGKPEVIQPSIGLYFTPHAATKLPMLLQLEDDEKLDIPAGRKDFLVTDDFTLRRRGSAGDLSARALSRQRHSGVGHAARRTKRTLIHIPHWNLNWQAVYRYAEPVRLPKGTTVSLRYMYDNSAENPLNPNHPPARVSGRESFERRDVPFVAASVASGFRSGAGDPRMALQEALARHNMRKESRGF